MDWDVPPLDGAQRNDIALCFRGRWLQGYVRGKLRFDPLYGAVWRIIRDRPAPVLDVGCGPGLLAHYLAARGCRVPYLGIDIDAAKIESARQAAHALKDVSFACGSGLALPPWQGHVALLDMLHYFEADAQRMLLEAAATRLTPGTAVIVRTMVRDASWRFRLNRLEDGFIRASRWIRSSVRHYPRLADLRRILAATGLRVEAGPLYGHTPFNSYLISAHRPEM